MKFEFVSIFSMERPWCILSGNQVAGQDPSWGRFLATKKSLNKRTIRRFFGARFGKYYDVQRFLF